MKSQIDLFKNSKYNLKQDKHFLLRVISIGVLFCVSITAVIFFILISLSPLPSLLERENDELKRLSVYSETIVKLDSTKKRIAFIEQILNERPRFHDSLDLVSSILPAGVEMSALKVEEKALLISFSSRSLSPLDLLSEDLVKQNNDKKLFSKITLLSGTYDEVKGEYILNLKLKTK